MDLCFALVDSSSAAVKSSKLKHDICYLVDNLFSASPMIKRHLFGSGPTRVKSNATFDKSRYSSKHSDESERNGRRGAGHISTRYLVFLEIF